jgi:small-conductance mechanosensitive channel
MQAMARLTLIGLIILAVAVLSAAFPVSGSAQKQTAEAPPDTAPAPPPIQPIAASDVPKKAEETSAKLRDIRSNAKPDPGVSSIAEDFPDLELEIDEALASVDSLDIIRAPTVQLSEELQIWQRRRIRLNDWQSTVRRRSQSLEESRQETRKLQQVWLKTGEASVEGETPEAITVRIARVLADIDTVYAVIGAQLDTVLTLQDRLSQQLIVVDESIQTLHEAESRVQLMILTADAPPIWKEIFAPADTATIAHQAQAAWRNNLAMLDDYIRRYSSRFWDQLIALVLVLAALIALAWRSRRWPTDDEDLKRAVSVVRRPVASALLITLSFSFWFHPQAPSSLGELFQLLILLPLIRLIPVLARPENRRPLYVIAIVFGLDQILNLAAERSLLQRLLQIGMAGVALAALGWLLRRGASGTGGRIVVLLARIGFILIAISLLGNVFGFVSLANYLLRATLTSGYLGLIVIAAYLVLQSLFAGILQTNTARNLRMIRLRAPLVKQKIFLLLRLFFIGLWIWAVLRQYGIWDETSGGLSRGLGREWTIGSMSISIGDILAFFFAIWLAVQVSKLVQFVLGEDVLPRMKLPRGVPSAITRVSGILIVGFGFVLACAAAGIDLNQFTLLAGALGVGVGFGMQNIVNNFISGMILIFERPISSGDLVQFGTMWGTVQRIGFRSSTIRTFSGADVIVPNGNLISQEVTNWSRSDQLRRVEIKVGLAYGTNPDRVIEVLEGVADAHRDIFKEPKPYVVFHGFGDSSLNFELRAWTRLDDWLRVSTETTVKVNNALNEAGLEIPFPQRDLHLRSVDPEVRNTMAGGKPEPTVDRSPEQATTEPPSPRRRMEGQELDPD